MEYGDQSEIITFLSQRVAGDNNTDSRIVTTHMSVVILKADRAWKLKRAVRLPYADFSRPELRLAACEREVTLNRRTAPSIYIGARRVTRQADGSLALDGPGQLVDAVVEMRRFDGDTLFSKLAAAGRLERPLLTTLARDIAAFHRLAEVRPGGGAENIEAILQLNEQATQVSHVLGAAAVSELRTALRAGLKQHGARLNARALAGRIRLCHGDLHLRNLCLVDGQPTLFDCIEFNDSLATIDVLYDLAFLLMDLWQAGLPAQANWLMNRYLDENDETDGLPLLPYFMALRASIRAQVLATQASLPGEKQQRQLASQADSYLKLALQLLQPIPPRLVAIGGPSGSGKSTRAAAIAHHTGAAPGARVLATDRIRKKLAGVPAETPLPAERYTTEFSGQVYETLYTQAAQTLTEGYSAIAEGVFSRQAEREAIQRCAERAGVPFTGIWLQADAATLVARVRARRNDPSDATEDVVKAQLNRGFDDLRWVRACATGSDEEFLQLLHRQALEAATESMPRWAEAPAGWNWLAQDADGRWYWYAVEPQLGMAGGIWRSPRRAQQFAAQGQPNPLWYESCTTRPPSADARSLSQHDRRTQDG